MSVKIMPSKESEYVSSYNRKYYEKNRSALLEAARATVTCECGKVCNAQKLSRHKKSKLHEKRLKQKVFKQIGKKGMK